MLRYMTGGESHGQAVVVIIDGLPARIPVNLDDLNELLAARQQGPGRGGRMKIEKDEAVVLAGIRGGYTLGSPVSIVIRNRDNANWSEVMDPFKPSRAASVTIPRPGHADLAGALKYGAFDIRDVIERSSARETAGRVAAGGLCLQFLKCLGIFVHQKVVKIGGIPWQIEGPEPDKCIMDIIESNRQQGDTLGADIEIEVVGVPAGLGSGYQRDRRIDMLLAGAIMSIPSVKAVGLGMGADASARPGSQVHDPIMHDQAEGLIRTTNNAGGVEGGMTNGMPLIISASIKPVPTLQKGLDTVDMATGEAVRARYERSDICVAHAAAVVAAAETAVVMAGQVLEKFGGDSLEEVAERVAIWRMNTGRRLSVSARSPVVSECDSFASCTPIIWLTGFMGAGKTAAGRELSRLTGIPLVDSDEEIEKRYGLAAADLIRRYGEACFRALESAVITRLSAGSNIIVSAGGGAFAQPLLQGRMLESGTVIWLDADEETIMKRCRQSDGGDINGASGERPLLESGWRGLLKKRLAFYSEAHHRIDTSARTIRQVAEEIMQACRTR